MICWTFALEWSACKCHTTTLMISQRWFRQWLGAITNFCNTIWRHQAIIILIMVCTEQAMNRSLNRCLITPNCVTLINSGPGIVLWPVRRKAIIWTNDFYRNFRNNFCWNMTQNTRFLFMKMNFKVSHLNKFLAPTALLCPRSHQIPVSWIHDGLTQDLLRTPTVKAIIEDFSARRKYLGLG